ncbi:MAG: sugar ABC transporter ATP-binding protein [Bauldia sp.]|nr:sugar ABC transporter ATP-binding protein [Bauldia sp.]
MTDYDRDKLGHGSDRAEPALECKGLVKTFGGVRALRGVDFSVPRGTVEALVGQNGAGKSTLIGILTGRIAPTSGDLRIFGTTPVPGDPRASRAAGLVAIYQELTLVPAITAEENVFLGMTPSVGGFVDRKKMRAAYREFCARLDVNIPPRTLAKDLSVADGQLLEIMRALAADARIILLDEPTAALSVSERNALLKLVRQLREQGVTMVFISHNLEEVLGVADHVTVLRDGSVAGGGPVEEWTRGKLVRTMLGDKARHLAQELLDEDTSVPASPVVADAPVEKPRDDAAPILEATGVTLSGAITAIDVTVRRGEILGLGGVAGSGRSSLMRCLAGAEPESRGALRIDGRDVPWPRSVAAGLKNGVALIPEDRKNQGLVLPMKAVDNIALARFSKVAQGGWWLSHARMRKYVAEFVGEFGFDPARLDAPAETLSGGNQQKLMLARWRYETPRVILADEPTRGVDVGAKEEILQSLRRFADNGIGVIIASSELEDVSLIADRVLVLADGVGVAELVRGSEPVHVHEILSAALEPSRETPSAA